MGAAAGLHDDTTRRPVGEERHDPGASKNLALYRAGIWLDIMGLENALGQVDGNGHGFHLVLLGGRTAEPAMSRAQDAGPAALGGPFRREATVPS
jgi:hypothetical protein